MTKMHHHQPMDAIRNARLARYPAAFTRSHPDLPESFLLDQVWGGHAEAALRASYFKHQTDTGLPCKRSDFCRAFGLSVLDIVDPLASLSDEMFQAS
jgi:hypothetical protein